MALLHATSPDVVRSLLDTGLGVVSLVGMWVDDGSLAAYEALRSIAYGDEERGAAEQARAERWLRRLDTPAKRYAREAQADYLDGLKRLVDEARLQ